MASGTGPLQEPRGAKAEAEGEEKVNTSASSLFFSLLWSSYLWLVLPIGHPTQKPEALGARMFLGIGLPDTEQGRERWRIAGGSGEGRQMEKSLQKRGLTSLV